MVSQMDLRALARRMVEKAQRGGAAQAEAYLLDSRELSVDVANQEVETLKQAADRGLGLRVIRDGRMGYSFTSDLREEALDRCVREALDNAARTAQDEHHRLPGKGGDYAKLDLLDPAIAKTPLADKIELAKAIEGAARAYDPRVKITERSAYSDSEYEVIIVNSEGIDASYRGSYCGAYAYLAAEENGDSQTGFAMHYDLRYANLDPEKIGREAAEKAVRALGAVPVKGKQAPVVFDPHVATQFLGLIAPALSAEAVQKGKSLFAGKKGQKVASPLITLIDDGARPGAVLSAPFDGEGAPTRCTTLVRDGVLFGYLHNTYTAGKDGVASTGNGIRHSFKGTPEVGTTNFYIAPGKVSPEKLIGEVADGFYVTEVMGMHTANPISGDFSVGASGIWIEQGRLTKAVRGMAIAGNIMEVLAAIDGVADDLTFFVGTGSPTLRVSRLSISGA